MQESLRKKLLLLVKTFTIFVMAAGVILAFVSKEPLFESRWLPILATWIPGGLLIYRLRKPLSDRQVELAFFSAFWVSVSYAFCLFADLFVLYLLPIINVHGDFQWREMYITGRDAYTRKLLPNVDKWFLYDSRLIHLKTNSLGHRDEEVDFRAGERNILISGDSFTYGHGLSQDETIPKKMEVWGARLGKPIHTYNIGYSASGAFDTFRELEIMKLPHVTDYVYVFHGNDITEIMAPRTQERELVVYKNMAMMKYKPNGQANTESDFEEMIRNYHSSSVRALIEERNFRKNLLGILSLKNLRTHLQLNIKSLFRFGPPPVFIGGKGPDCTQKIEVSRELEPGVAATLEYSLRMAKLAKERGANFHVVITPEITDLANKFYKPATAAFICRARAQGIRVIDTIIERLNMHTDLIKGDWHYNPAGADKAARAVMESL